LIPHTTLPIAVRATEIIDSMPELIRRHGPWKGIDDVEYATLEWVDWFNHRRLLEPIGHVPPAEFEAAYYGEEVLNYTPGLKQSSLR